MAQSRATSSCLTMRPGLHRSSGRRASGRGGLSTHHRCAIACVNVQSLSALPYSYPYSCVLLLGAWGTQFCLVCVLLGTLKRMQAIEHL